MKITNEIFHEIIDRISEGESVNNIFKDKRMPSRSSFYKFIAQSKQNGDRSYFDIYETAKQCRADYYFEQIFDLDERLLNGELDYQTYKTLLDGRKWTLSRMDNRYRDKPQIEGPQTDSSSINITINRVIHDKNKMLLYEKKEK